MALCLPVPLFAQSKEDLMKKGDAEVNKGNAIGARDAYCAAAQKDSGDANAASQCKLYTNEANNFIKQQNNYYTQGLQALQDGKLDEAEKLFKRVKLGDRLADAQKQLGIIADQKNKASASAAADAQMETKFNNAVSAFNSGDISGAKSGFSGITGKHAGEAGDYTSKIREYEAKMSEADIYVSGKDYASAKRSYMAAAIAIPNSPAKSKIGEMDRLTASATTTTIPTPPVNIQPNPGGKPVVDTAPRQIVDIKALLADAQKFLDKKDYKNATKKVMEVKNYDRKNKDAQDLLDEIKSKQPASASVGDEDPELSQYIKYYYSGSYDDAEASFRDYTKPTNNPKKPGLANFYWGISLATRYYLSGVSDTDRDGKLLNEAKKKFKSAKDVKDFVPPDKKYVSPKLLDIYKSS